MRIPKINYNCIKSFFKSFSKTQQPKLQEISGKSEPARDVFVKSKEAAFDYLSEKLPKTEEIFDNLNTAFEKGKANIKPSSQDDVNNLPGRTAIYGQSQEKLIKEAKNILEKSKNKEGVKAILNAMSKNERIFEQREISVKRYETSAQILINTLPYADTSQKLNIMYKFVKNIDFDSRNVKGFCECLKNSNHLPDNIKLKLMDKFTSEEFLPIQKNTSWNIKNYAKKPLYNELSTLNNPQQAELLDKLTNLNDEGNIYVHLAGYLENFTPEQAKYISKLLDDNKNEVLRYKFSPPALELVQNCKTEEQFELFRKYITHQHVISPFNNGINFGNELILTGEIINKMDEAPEVVKALNKFLDDKKYLNTALDKGLYKILYTVDDREYAKYLDTILDDPKLYDNNTFLTEFFLAKNENEINKLIKNYSKGDK